VDVNAGPFVWGAMGEGGAPGTRALNISLLMDGAAVRCAPFDGLTPVCSDVVTRLLSRAPHDASCASVAPQHVPSSAPVPALLGVRHMA
jgi:hypothetical protein